MTFGRKQGLRLAILAIFTSLTLTVVIPATPASAATIDTEEAALCQLINTYRAQSGLAPLLLSSSLTNDAEWHSADMAQKNYFNHTDSLGRDAFQRMTAFGYSYATAKGENIAAGSSTAAATFAQWKASPPHNANMLSASFRVIGLGRAYQATSQYGWYWTNPFGGYNDGGTPCPVVAQPALAVNDVSFLEGNSGTKTVNFTITRSGNTVGTSSVQYATANLTATAGVDYMAVPLTTVNFAAGETVKAAAVTIYGDTIAEPNEGLTLNLSSATGATISDSRGDGTILNDDTNLRVNDISFSEGNTSATTAAFTISRSGNTLGTTTVRYTTGNGSALAGSDYVALPPTTVSFAPGETTKSVAVTSVADTTPEPAETFFLRLSSATGAALADPTGTATIQNDD